MISISQSKYNNLLNLLKKSQFTNILANKHPKEFDSEIKTLIGHNNWINSVSFSHDDKYIVSGSRDNTIKIWDFKTGEYVKTLTGHNYYIWSVSISHDDKYIVSGSYDKIKIWDFESGKCVKTLIGHNYFISLSISRDNKYIVSGSNDKTIKIWDFKTGECVKTLTGHDYTVNSVSISHDDKYIDHRSTHRSRTDRVCFP